MDAVELLIKNNYCITVKKSRDNIINVSFPDNNLLDYKSVEYQYMVSSNTLTFINNGRRKEYTISNDCIRLAVMLDIIIKGANRDLNQKLIVAFNEDGSKNYDLLSLIGKPPKNEEIESKLYFLISNRENNEEAAEKEGILEEYKCLMKIYESRNGLSA